MKICISSIKKDKFRILLLFIFPLWPFCSFVLSCFDIKSRTTCIIFTLYFFLIGCCFLLNNELVDSYRYSIDFADIINYNITYVLQKEILLGKTDFYSLLISFIASKISHSPRFLFGCFGAIFGLLIYQFLRIINCYKPQKYILQYIVAVLIIILLNPHTNINGVRYWTATWLAFSSFISYIHNNNNKWLVIFMITPLVHSSFIIVDCVYFIAYILKNRIHILAKIALVSVIVSIFFNIISIVSFIPDNLGIFSHYSVYVDSDYVYDVLSRKNERSTINKVLTNLTIYYAILIIYRCFCKEYTMMKQENNLLYSMFLIMISFLSIFGNYSSMGRFYTLTWMLLIFILISGFRWRNLNKRTLLYITIIPFVYFGTIYNNLYIHSSVLDFGYLYKPVLSLLTFMKEISI